MAEEKVYQIVECMAQTTGYDMLELSSMIVCKKMTEVMGLCESVMKEKNEIESKLKGLQILYWQEVESHENERKERKALQLQLANMNELLKKEQSIAFEIAEENEQLKRELMMTEVDRIDELEALLDDLINEKAILQEERELVMKTAAENEKFKIEQAESEMLEDETWPQPELEEVLLAEKELLQEERDIAKKISEEYEEMKIERASMEDDLKRIKGELSEKASDIIELQEKIEAIAIEKNNLEKLVAALKDQFSSTISQSSQPATSVQPSSFDFMMPVFDDDVDSNQNCHQMEFENGILVREKMAFIQALETEKEQIIQLKQELENAKNDLQLYKLLISFDFIQEEEMVPAPELF